jgi:hypothetical protein
MTTYADQLARSAFNQGGAVLQPLLQDAQSPAAQTYLVAIPARKTVTEISRKAAGEIVASSQVERDVT